MSNKRFSCAFGDYEDFPIGQVRNPSQILELDLSHNNFSDVGFLAAFVRVEMLVLDGNQVGSQTKFPPLPHLQTLWLNKNNVINLSYFIDTLVSSCPNIKYLSMLNNPACPNYFNGGTPQQYVDYRLFVISRFKQLLALDDSKVTAAERAESEKMYGHFKKQGKQNDPGRLGAKIKKKKVRVSTNFVAAEAGLSPRNDNPGVSSGPQPPSATPQKSPRDFDDSEEEEEEQEDEERVEVPVSPKPQPPSKSHSILASQNDDSSDWSTDSGDASTPLRTEMNRRLSPPSPFANEESPSPSSKRGELLRTLHQMQPKKQVNFRDTASGGGEAGEPGTASHPENEEHGDPERKERKEAEEAAGVEEEEEEEPREVPKKPKKKRGNDPLHLELQARLGLKSTAAHKKEQPNEEGEEREPQEATKTRGGEGDDGEGTALSSEVPPQLSTEE